MLARVFSCAVIGLEGVIVEVEVDSASGLPVSAYTPEQYSPIIYRRAPLFIDALRDKMGESQFDDFLKKYFQTYQWSISTTAGFRTLAEESCGCNLEELFTEWVYSN